MTTDVNRGRLSISPLDPAIIVDYWHSILQGNIGEWWKAHTSKLLHLRNEGASDSTTESLSEGYTGVGWVGTVNSLELPAYDRQQPCLVLEKAPYMPRCRHWELEVSKKF